MEKDRLKTSGGSTTEVKRYENGYASMSIERQTVCDTWYMVEDLPSRLFLRYQGW
jgi:hypothetical protein